MNIDILLAFDENMKFVAYSFQGNHTGQLDSATDWWMAAWQDNVISICFVKHINLDSLNQTSYFSIK